MKNNQNGKASNACVIKVATDLYNHIIVMKVEEERNINVVANRLIRKGMESEGIDLSKIETTQN